MSSISQKTKEILEINQPTWVLREKIASVNADLKVFSNIENSLKC